MSPLISLLEKEIKPGINKHEHNEQEKNKSGKECGCGHCTCVKPCANCTCRDRKERQADLFMEWPEPLITGSSVF